jgi:hypothetical protein
LIGLESYKEHVTLLKSDEKLKRQDEYWKKMVTALGEKEPDLWVYIPTI